MRILYTHSSYGKKNFLSTTESVVIGRQKADLDLTPDLQVSQLHASWFSTAGARSFYKLRITGRAAIRGSPAPCTRLSVPWKSPPTSTPRSFSQINRTKGA